MNGERYLQIARAEDGFTARSVMVMSAAALATGLVLSVPIRQFYQDELKDAEASLKQEPQIHAIQAPESDENQLTIPTPPKKSSSPSPTSTEIIVPSLSPSPSASVVESPTTEQIETPSSTTEQLQTPQPKIEVKPRTAWEQARAISPETAEVESALLHTVETIVNKLVTSKTDRVVGEGGVLKSADIKSESYDELAEKALQLVASDATLSLAVSGGFLELGYSNAAGEQASVAFVSEAGTVPPSDRTALADWLKQSSMTNVCSMVPELVDPTIVERLDDEDTNLNPMNAPGTFKGACYIVSQDGNWQESAMALLPEQSLLGATTQETIVAVNSSINKMFPEIPAMEKLIEEGIK